MYPIPITHCSLSYWAKSGPRALIYALLLVLGVGFPKILLATVNTRSRLSSYGNAVSRPAFQIPLAIATRHLEIIVSVWCPVSAIALLRPTITKGSHSSRAANTHQARAVASE